jgi:hypothetical protein
LSDVPPTRPTSAAIASEDSRTVTATDLFERAIADVAQRGVRHDTTERLAAVGAAIKGSRWRSYRAGRARLCGLTGIYWCWLAPNTDWNFLHLTGGLWWQRDGETFVDIAVWDTGLDDPTVRRRVQQAIESGQKEHGNGFVGVRLLAMTGVMRSRFITPNGHSVALCDTEYWFGDEHRD